MLSVEAYVQQIVWEGSGSTTYHCKIVVHVYAISCIEMSYT